MAKKRTMNEYRQTKDAFYKVPTHDPQTGELNPHYEELTKRKNPWNLYGPPKIGSEGEVHPETGDDHLEPTLYDELVALRKKYTDDKEFGYHVAKELL
jgi:hypothetical protein